MKKKVIDKIYQEFQFECEIVKYIDNNFDFLVKKKGMMKSERKKYYYCKCCLAILRYVYICIASYILDMIGLVLLDLLI